MLRRYSLCLLVTVAILYGCFTCAPSTQAQTTTYQFSGVLDFTGPGVGDFVDFSGEFTLDPAEPDQNPDPVLGLFDLSNVNVNFDDGRSRDISQGQLSQSGSFQSITLSDSGGGNSLGLLYSPNVTDFNSPQLLDLALFDGGSAIRTGGGIGVGGVSSISIEAVPEPGAFSIVLLLLVSCTSMRRR